MLNRHDVHLWHFQYAELLKIASIQSIQWLNTQESAFHMSLPPHHQTQWLLTRNALKKVLAHYTQRAIDTIHINTATHGKPYLPESKIHFNLSHTQQQLCIACGLHPLGVDLAIIKSYRYKNKIIARYGSSRERQAWGNANPGKKDQLFASFWARREACLKMLGLPIYKHIQQFETLWPPHQPNWQAMTAPLLQAAQLFEGQLDNDHLWALITSNPKATLTQHDGVNRLRAL